MDWCEVVRWAPLGGLLLDAIGVVILTADILPDFNDYRAVNELEKLRRQLEVFLNSGLEATRGPEDPKFGRSTIALEGYDSAIAARLMAAATVPLDFENLQTALRRIRAAKWPISFLGPPNDPMPSDLAGIHRAFRTWSIHLNDFALGPGARVRLPIYWASAFLISGFVLQAIGNVPGWPEVC